MSSPSFPASRRNGGGMYPDSRRTTVGQLPTVVGNVAVPSGSAATDRANINAAITTAGSDGQVILQAGTYQTDQMITVPDGVTLRGGGGSHQLGVTTIKCTTSGAGVTFNGRGGPNVGIRIDGNNTAIQPWIVGAGLDRTFVNVSAANSAQDGLTVNSTQNTNFIGCGVDTNTRDGLILDLGCGGLVFERFENNAAGRYAVHIQQSGASPGNAYPATFGPTDIVFLQCIFERQSNDFSIVQIDQGTQILFDHCAFSRSNATATTPSLTVAALSGGNVPTRVEARGCYWAAQSGATSTISPGQSQLLVLSGMNTDISGNPFIDGSNTGATVWVQEMPNLTLGQGMFTAGTSNNGQASVYEPANVHKFWTMATGNLIARSRVSGESFDRMQWFGSGSLLLGGGAASPDATLARQTGGAIGFSKGARAGVAAPTYSASITPDSSAGNWQTITVTNGTAFTINAPANAPSSSFNQELTIEVLNSSGGAMGAITWNAAFVFAGLSWTNPANTKKRFARFEWNGAAWVCTTIAAADY